MKESNAFRALKQFAGRPQEGPPRERCELCGTGLGPEHPHLVEIANRKLVCACLACSILFSRALDEGGRDQRYRRVPRRIQYLSGFRLSESQWDALRMPINMAFFYFSTPAGRMLALYPSPAGATESLLSLEAWSEIVSENPVLETMEPDVEALLANRIGHARGFHGSQYLMGPEYFLVPIDECFKLVGLIRSRWQGLSGGAEVWNEIGGFFTSLKARSTELQHA